MKIAMRLGYIFDRVFPSLAMIRHKEKFASHLPVLIAMGALSQPKHVLELGAGFFSTAAFMDQSLFPTLQSITSVEDDLEWSHIVRKERLGDDRLHLLDVESVPDWAETADLRTFPLIFIDDSKRIAHRVQTIRSVLARATPETVIVIHDFEQEAYQTEVDLPWLAFRFAAFMPETAVVFQNPDLRAGLEKIDQVMMAHCHTLRPSSGADWAKVFQGAGIAGLHATPQERP